MSVRSTGARSPLPTAVPFTTAIPLDGDRTLPRTFADGALAFTPGATANGGQAVLPLVADGVGPVTFPGFTEYGGSAGYDDTAGILNLIQFFHLDDTPYVSVTQAVNAQPIRRPATAYALTGPASARVGSPSTYTLRSNGLLASAVAVTPNDGGAGGAFSPTTVMLSAGDATAATFSYTPSSAGARTLGATNGGGLGDPAGLSVTAVAAPAVSYLRLASLSGLVESVHGAGYDYTATSDNAYSGGTATSTVAIPGGQDGFIGATLAAVGANGPIVGLKTPAPATAFDQFAYGIYPDTGGGVAYYRTITGGGGGGAPDAQIPFAAGDLYRLRRSGTVVTAEVSKDGGQTYAVAKTWTGATGAALYGGFQTGSTAMPITLPFASTNAA